MVGLYPVDRVEGEKLDTGVAELRAPNPSVNPTTTANTTTTASTMIQAFADPPPVGDGGLVSGSHGTAAGLTAVSGGGGGGGTTGATGR